jgi:hypothetical protein
MLGLRLVRQRENEPLARRVEAACGGVKRSQRHILHHASDAAGVRKLPRPARIRNHDGARRGEVIDERLRPDDRAAADDRGQRHAPRIEDEQHGGNKRQHSGDEKRPLKRIGGRCHEDRLDSVEHRVESRAVLGCHLATRAPGIRPHRRERPIRMHGRDKQRRDPELLAGADRRIQDDGDGTQLRPLGCRVEIVRDHGRARDEGERDPQVAYGEIDSSTRGRSLGEDVLDQRRQCQAHAEPGDALRDDEPANVVRRQKRERADAAADQRAPRDNTRFGVATHEKARERRNGNEGDRERRRERTHRPADDKQPHKAEEERREGA